MAEVLHSIVARKRAEVAARLTGPVEAPPTTRSLRAALARPGARFIMEVKPRSPSGHVARHDPCTAIRAYAPIADALSVLTDGPGFGGSLALLAATRTRFDGPILAKDFIVDPAQVSEARAHGADAVLCMLSVLGDDEALAVLAEARRLAMDVLVEVHDEIELDRALALGATLVGINNRDLKTLSTDLDVTRRLARHAPDHVTLVSESGISGRDDTLSLAPLVDGFLVGSHLMAARDIARAVRELVYGRVKICGLTNADDVIRAAHAGASYAGLIMVPGTPRAIDASRAALLSRIARANGMKSVAVFRDATLETVLDTVEGGCFDVVQFHGREDQAAIDALRALQPALELWTTNHVDLVQTTPGRVADRLLFDHRDGGSGRPFDWSLVADHPDLSQAFLAGGIGPGNARAAANVGAYGLDVGSQVEAAPGTKDQAKLAELFAALRAPGRRIAA